MENQYKKMNQDNKVNDKTINNALFADLDILSEYNLKTIKEVNNYQENCWEVKTMKELNNYLENCWEEVNNCLSETTRDLLDTAYGIDSRSQKINKSS
jgi:hypothetical protein